jgi:hypothetical protein
LCSFSICGKLVYLDRGCACSQLIDELALRLIAPVRFGEHGFNLAGADNHYAVGVANHKIASLYSHIADGDRPADLPVGRRILGCSANTDVGREYRKVHRQHLAAVPHTSGNDKPGYSRGLRCVRHDLAPIAIFHSIAAIHNQHISGASGIEAVVNEQVVTCWRADRISSTAQRHLSRKRLDRGRSAPFLLAAS